MNIRQETTYVELNLLHYNTYVIDTNGKKKYSQIDTDKINHRVVSENNFVICQWNFKVFFWGGGLDELETLYSYLRYVKYYYANHYTTSPGFLSPGDGPRTFLGNKNRWLCRPSKGMKSSDPGPARCQVQKDSYSNYNRRGKI